MKTVDLRATTANRLDIKTKAAADDILRRLSLLDILLA
jgi:hypothetical protein